MADDAPATGNSTRLLAADRVRTFQAEDVSDSANADRCSITVKKRAPTSVPVVELLNSVSYFVWNRNSSPGGQGSSS